MDIDNIVSRKHGFLVISVSYDLILPSSGNISWTWDNGYYKYVPFTAEHFRDSHSLHSD